VASNGIINESTYRKRNGNQKHHLDTRNGAGNVRATRDNKHHGIKRRLYQANKHQTQTTYGA